jgi:hypothetical protein
MKISSYIGFSLCLFISMLVAMGLPQQGLAQRFGHSNFGGGGGGGRSAPAMSRPAPSFSRPAPAPSRPAPAPSRPVPAVVNRPMESNRPAEAPANRSINGGASNFGSHDLNRAPANVHENVTVHQNVDVHRNVNVHENVNVYHSHNQPYHPYAYHPYHPYYWGHNWHPVGFFLASLAADAYLFSLANQQYYYDDGVYYEPSQGGYSAVPAPVGAVVNALPPGYETTMVGNDTYYYYGGAFYIDTGNGYQVVQAPFGAVVTQIPDGAQDQTINGQDYLVFNNTYYQPISQDGQDAYEVVQVN